ncbi:MAG: hypothetical protein EU548_10175 [Promethearchaeota archaeon]|nr:MAG: hypothetical protein EU548_10175 [Candidatus Lokiarchaeota archaeon]
MSKKTVEINITGIVQGVGFRPFLFNLARNLGLNGYVFNRGNAGVRLILQGESKNIDQFIMDVDIKRPKISFIENLDVMELLDKEIFSDFKILPTRKIYDGTKDGYDLEMTRGIAEATGLPITASGGAGTLQHILEAFTYSRYRFA